MTAPGIRIGNHTNDRVPALLSRAPERLRGLMAGGVSRGDAG